MEFARGCCCADFCVANKNKLKKKIVKKGGAGRGGACALAQARARRETRALTRLEAQSMNQRFRMAALSVRWCSGLCTWPNKQFALDMCSKCQHSTTAPLTHKISRLLRNSNVVSGKVCTELPSNLLFF